MSRVRVAAFSLSVDGYGAGPDQSLAAPLGRGAERLHDWLFPTRTFQATHGGGSGGETGIDDDFAAKSFENLGAWILGRNMFGPVRGPWAVPNQSDQAWNGWWGDNPPYHTAVFVLTHYPRPPLEMEGGTVFHFVTEGIVVALERARQAAGDKDVRIGGGVATVRAYLKAGLIDDLHLAQTPVILGSGESLFSGLDLKALGYGVEDHVCSGRTTHLVISRKAKN